VKWPCIPARKLHTLYSTLNLRALVSRTAVTCTICRCYGGDSLAKCTSASPNKSASLVVGGGEGIMLFRLLRTFSRRALFFFRPDIFFYDILYVPSIRKKIRHRHGIPVHLETIETLLKIITYKNLPCPSWILASDISPGKCSVPYHTSIWRSKLWDFRMPCTLHR
jgi:hypothetical protein